MTRVLIIGGSAEALALALALPGATVRLPGAERVRRPWPTAPARLTDADFDAGPDAVIDASHPVDLETACRVARACRARGLPHCQLVRPSWRPSRRDRWHAIARPEQAAGLVPRQVRVLVTLGRSVLPRLNGLRAQLLIRRLGADPSHDPVGRMHVIRGQGPFTAAEEVALMRRHRIDWVLSYNAGGSGGWPKLAAARALGLPVALIDRPRRPDGPRVTTVEEALTWLNR